MKLFNFLNLSYKGGVTDAASASNDDDLTERTFIQERRTER